MVRKYLPVEEKEKDLDKVRSFSPWGGRDTTYVD